MKKVLFASTILASLGSVAAAETGVSISGYGRFGLQYYGNEGVKNLWAGSPGTYANGSSTSVETRFRLNIDAKTETDTGVTFGGRLRLQYDDGAANSRLSPALMYATYEGFRLEVGNVNSALDNDAAGLYYGSEIGLIDSSFGDSLIMNYFGIDGFTTGSYGDVNRNGIAASYSIDGFYAMASFIDYDQYDVGTAYGKKSEKGLYLSYTSGQFTVAAGAALDAAGVTDADTYFVGGKYDISDIAYVGLNYTSEGKIDKGLPSELDLDSTITLYGGYTIDALTLKGYIAYNGISKTVLNTETGTTYGIGADYDLGGAKLTGSIQQDLWEETYADVGVRFDF